MEKYIKTKERIFKPLKDLDAEIRFIESEQDKDKQVYYSVDVGLCESLGEQGFIYTFFYDTYPKEEEIKEDVKEYIRDQIKELSEKLLGAYEENHLIAMQKLDITYKSDVLTKEGEHLNRKVYKGVPVKNITMETLKDITKIKTKGEAQQIAMDFQNWASNENLSYGELIEFGSYFEELGNKFNLNDEFKENGII